MKNQTAVEWLESEYEKLLNWHIPMELLEQAKEMEKQQIIDAFLEGCSDNNNDGFEYYNQTFKSE